MSQSPSQSQNLQRREQVRTDTLARYGRMAEIREFEDRVNELFASGEIHGTTHLCQGQEAVAVGLASVLRPTDVVAATYRGHGIALALGMTPESILAEIMGRETGCTNGVGGSMHLCDADVGLLPTSAIIGAGLPIAAGAALAFQTRGEDRVAVAVFGDGASNIGAFHEALNLAAVWKLPVVFLCDNNVYGEYSRIDRTTAVLDISQRATGYAIPGTSVDGMDLEIVRDTLTEAIERARSGGGPTLVEARTYRFAGHSRADQATYRPAGELDEWRRRDPVMLTRTAMLDAGAAEDDLKAAEDRARQLVDDAVAAASAAAPPGPAAMFQNVWADADERVA